MPLLGGTGGRAEVAQGPADVYASLGAASLRATLALTCGGAQSALTLLPTASHAHTNLVRQGHTVAHVAVTGLEWRDDGTTEHSTHDHTRSSASSAARSLCRGQSCQRRGSTGAYLARECTFSGRCNDTCEGEDRCGGSGGCRYGFEGALQGGDARIRALRSPKSLLVRHFVRRGRGSYVVS